MIPLPREPLQLKEYSVYKEEAKFGICIHCGNQAWVHVKLMSGEGRNLCNRCSLYYSPNYKDPFLKAVKEWEAFLNA